MTHASLKNKIGFASKIDRHTNNSVEVVLRFINILHNIECLSKQENKE